MTRTVLISAYYNRENLVEETLAGIAAQTYEDFKAYFYDDGSKDETYRELKRFESERINVFRQANKGLVRTFIDAIEQTDSEFIAIQGSGDYSHPERLARQVAYMDANPDCVVVGCYSELVADKTTIDRTDVASDVFAQLYKGNPFYHGETLIRRSAYEKCGGYREFFTYRQDLDLWLRIAEHGRLYVLPEVLYRCYKVPDSVSLNPEKLFRAMACRDFAVYCAKERHAGRPDPLDVHGPVAALERPRSRELALALQRRARQLASKGKLEDAQILLRASRNELNTVKTQISATIISNPLLLRTYKHFKDHG